MERGWQDLHATSDSFWEVGQYKRTVKRVEDGAKLCTDLITLIKERGEMEAAYAKQLRSWGRKWQEAIEKGPEYGSTEAAWKAVLTEADKRADMHTRMRDRLHEEVPIPYALSLPSQPTDGGRWRRR